MNRNSQRNPDSNRIESKKATKSIKHGLWITHPRIETAQANDKQTNLKSKKTMPTNTKCDYMTEKTTKHDSTTHKINEVNRTCLQ